MRYLLFLFVASLMVLSCNKDKQKMTVIKDCTGTYLRNDKGLDFLVCNYKELSSFSDGTKIKVEVESLAECFGLGQEVTCTMAHINEGKIEIVKIY